MGIYETKSASEEGLSGMNEMEVSVIIPCMNEENTVGICVRKAVKALKDLDVDGEVVVVDRSTDRSPIIAKSMGARVIKQHGRGYGNAYKLGVSSSRGKYLVMADGDNTYDLSDLGKFIQPLREGYDMVAGTRLKGKIMPGAMPWLHKIGNPLLSGFMGLLFRTKISDINCGMRSFTRESFERMHMRSDSWEFAAEMILNSTLAGLRVKEVPITYYASKVRESHVNSFGDGWRALRLMILFSPYYLFFVPGTILFLLGIVSMLLLTLNSPLIIGRVSLGATTSVLSSMLTLLGYNIIAFGYFAKMHHLKISYFEKPEGAIKRIHDWFVLERGLKVGLMLCLAGFLINLSVLLVWINRNLGGLQESELTLAVDGFTIFIIGVQTVFNSFLLSILKIEKDENAFRGQQT